MATAGEHWQKGQLLARAFTAQAFPAGYAMASDTSPHTAWMKARGGRSG